MDLRKLIRDIPDYPKEGILFFDITPLLGDPDGFRRAIENRQQQQHRGMKQLRIWVQDPHRPEFAAEAERQGLLLRGRPEETEALDFIAAATDWPEP